MHSHTILSGFMRNGLIGLVSAVALASTLVANGCSSSGSEGGGAGNGGSPASGGSSGSTGTATPVCGSNCPTGECQTSNDCSSTMICLSCPGFTDGSICKLATGPVVSGQCVPPAVGTSCQVDADCPSTGLPLLQCFHSGFGGGYCDLASKPETKPACRMLGATCVASSDCCIRYCCAWTGLAAGEYRCTEKALTPLCEP